MDKQNGLVPISGTLRLLGASETTPPSGPGGTFSQLAFNEAGNELIAVKKASSLEDLGKVHSYLHVSANHQLMLS